MQLKIKNFKPLRVVVNLSTQLFENLPTIVLFCVCAGTFYNFVYLLVDRFVRFDTTVLIRYEAPKRIRFPAFTICGCSSRKVACPISSWSEIQSEASSIESQYSVLAIMDNHSFVETDLVSQCYYFLDSRRPDIKFPCTDFETVVESMHDGRKCLTYFTILHDAHSRGQGDPEREFGDSEDDAQNSKTEDTSTATKSLTNDSSYVLNGGTLETTDMFTAFIYLKINFSSIYQQEYQQASTIQDASVIMSFHQTNVIPGLLDSEYIRIDPGQNYEIHFGKQVTYLKERPYWTKCQRYSYNMKPRSKNECVNLCILQQSFLRHGCINYYNIVTRAWLHWLNTVWNSSFVPESVRLCAAQNSTGIDIYLSYIRARRYCTDFCGRDCTEENYSLVTDQSPLHPEDGDQTMASGASGPETVTSTTQNNYSESVIVIWPDRKMYEIVQHNKEIDFFELIGCLGGHAHIWLGLSAIQLYDVVVVAIAKIKLLWQRFVYCA